MTGSKKKDLPYMPFYVGDWLKCPEVRALPPDYRGLWFDLLCYMWESTERGVMVTPNGRPYTDNEIIRMIGLDNQNSGIWLTSLIAEGVCHRRNDGAVFSKRMVKDEDIRQIRRETGALGGNPLLLDKCIDKVEDNQKPESDIESDTDNVLNVAFDVFWDLYAKKIDRIKCERKWVKLTDSEREECINKLPAYIKTTPDVQFRRNPETYLNNKSWQNEIINHESNTGTNRRDNKRTNDLWR